MAQIAYADTEKATTHLVVTFGVGVTLCGLRAFSFGRTLPTDRKRWPDLPWCERCVAAYE